MRVASKALATLLLALMVLSLAPVALPLSVAKATITGRPVVYYNNVYGDPLEVPAGTSVNIYLGEMSITGAQLWLWLSPYGGAEINRALGDRWYAGPFYVGDVFGAAPKGYSFRPPEPFAEEGRTYTFTVGKGWINGTIPFLVQGDVYYWIKVSDVSPRDYIPSTEVGVSTNRITFTPAYVVSPNTVAPNALITVTGYAVPVPEYYNISQKGTLFNGTIKVLWPRLLVPSKLISKKDPWGLWNYTVFTTSFNAMDLMLRLPDDPGIITVGIVQNSTRITVFTRNIDQPPRVVQLPSPWPKYDYRYDYTNIVTLETGKKYNVTLNWFSASGSFQIFLNTTPVASGALNATGGVYNFTITIPDFASGKYLFRVIDDLGVEYNFFVSVVMVPYILVKPDKGYVGDSFTVIGKNFLDYVGRYVTIWFNNSAVSPYRVLLANFTVQASQWTMSLVVPRSIGGARPVEVRDVRGVTKIASTEFTVLPKLEVVPSVIKNDGSLVRAVGTGLKYGVAYVPNIDNQFLAANINNYPSGIWANGTGDLEIRFVAAGFRPGLHVFSLYLSATTPPYAPAAYALFTVTVEGDPIVEFLKSINATVVEVKDSMAVVLAGQERLQVSLEAINAKLVSIEDGVAVIKTDLGTVEASLNDINARLVSISEGVATVKTDLGTIQTSLDNINAKLVSIDGAVAIIETDLGTVKTSLDAINARLVSIEGGVATIKTDLGVIKGTVTSISEGVAVIKTDVGVVKTDLGTVKAAIPGVKAATDALLVPVWVAAAFAIIATILAIVSIVLIQRKIAK